MDENIGQFLFLLAFVIIAAIQWVVKTIQARNAPSEPEEDPLEDTWRQLEEHHESRTSEGSATPEYRRQPEVQEDKSPSPINELKDLFASLRNPEPEPAPVQRRVPPPPVVVAKPPVPVSSVPSKRKDPRAGLSTAEREALKKFQESKSPMQVRGRGNHGDFRKFLRGAWNLRQALILKEVFDRPIALREKSIDESLMGS